MNIKFKNKTTVIITKSLGWSGQRPAPDQKAIIKKDSVLAEFKKQHPDIDIRMCFQNPHQKLSRTAKMTYAMWCDKHNIPWCKGPGLPRRWTTL